MSTTSKPLENEQESQEATFSTKDSKKYLARNTICQVALLLFGAVTSMYFVPYQIRHLGEANYGTITLATHVISWADVIAVAIVGTISRFVILHFSRNDSTTARSYFNTQLTGLTLLVLGLAPFAIAVAIFAPKLFKIPHGQEHNTQILFLITFLVFSTTLFTSAFQVALYVRQRMDIKTALDSSYQIIGYTMWILMFAMMRPAIWQIGLGRLVAAIAILVASVLLSRKLTPQLKPGLHDFDPAKFSETLKMGGWMTFARSGTMLYLYVDALVINRMLGPTDVGRYAAIAGLYIMLRGISGMLFGIISPPAIAYYARQDYDGLMRMISASSKFVSLTLAVVLGAACGLSKPFLIWWLDPSYGSLSLLVWILLSHLVLNISMDMPATISYASNKMIAPGVATIAGGFFKILIAVILLKTTHLGLFAVAIADLIGLSFKNLVLQPNYCAHAINRSSKPFYIAIIPSIFVYTGTAACAYYVSLQYNLATLPRLAAVGIAIMSISGALTYFLALNKNDKQLARDILTKKTT